MKFTAIIFCLFFSASLIAGNDEKSAEPTNDQLTIVVQGYENGLTHFNQGLVESTILNVLKYKCRYPHADLSRLQKPLQNLSKNGTTKDIREKAELVNKLFENPELIPSCSKELYADAERFFDILSIGVKLAQADATQSNRDVAAREVLR